MEVDDVVKALEVNCRIGSLESIRRRTFAVGIVNCRIGSLENPA